MRPPQNAGETWQLLDVRDRRVRASMRPPQNAGENVAGDRIDSAVNMALQ